MGSAYKFNTFTGSKATTLNFNISDLQNAAEENLIPEIFFSDFNNDTTFEVRAQAVGLCSTSATIATETFNFDVSPVADATVVKYSDHAT